MKVIPYPLYQVYKAWMEDIEMSPSDLVWLMSGGKKKTLTPEEKLQRSKGMWGAAVKASKDPNIRNAK